MDKYRLSLYAIVIVIIAVVGIQIYWNFFNYKSNKQQLINDVQISLDNAVDTYYTNLATKSTLGFSYEGDEDLNFIEHLKLEELGEKIDSHRKSFNNLDSLELDFGDDVRIYRGEEADSLIAVTTTQTSSGIKLSKKKYNAWGREIGSTSFTFNDLDSLPEADARRLLGIDSSFHTENFESINALQDSMDVSKINFLTSKIVISITTDSIPLDKLDTIIKSELSRKQIDLTYGLSFMEKDSSLYFLNKELIHDDNLSTRSKSTFLPKNTLLDIYFINSTKEILYRSLSGIIISLLLIIAVVSILIYLLNIIRNQKELASMKNDLISNITHEFKTPIATVGVALESMQDFNTLEDKSKTNKYLEMSQNQLGKLNLMVEKLLETASLDSESLTLKYEELDMVDMIATLVHNYRLQTNKQLIFTLNPEAIIIKGDPFHLENAVSNLIDNAIKYGGDKVEMTLEQTDKTINFSIHDNGTGLSKNEVQKVFDKFYRVSTGNTHDVKGFGIGLYYTKTIIEKHSGSVEVTIKNGTTFKIKLPNG